MDWLVDSFKEDPAGWISVIIALAGLVLSAVLWRRIWSVLKAIGRGIRALWRDVRKVRITTAGRIERKINDAVRASQRVDEPALYWQWSRDPRPGIWRLENHTGETCVVSEVVFDTDARWKWDAYPNFPLRVRDGWRVELRGRISAASNVPYISDDPGATIRWTDSHGDEDVIWAPFKDGMKFF